MQPQVNSFCPFIAHSVQDRFLCDLVQQWVIVIQRLTPSFMWNGWVHDEISRALKSAKSVKSAKLFQGLLMYSMSSMIDRLPTAKRDNIAVILCNNYDPVTTFGSNTRTCLYLCHVDYYILVWLFIVQLHNSFLPQLSLELSHLIDLLILAVLTGLLRQLRQLIYFRIYWCLTHSPCAWHAPQPQQPFATRAKGQISVHNLSLTFWQEHQEKYTCLKRARKTREQR